MPAKTQGLRLRLRSAGRGLFSECEMSGAAFARGTKNTAWEYLIKGTSASCSVGVWSHEGLEGENQRQEVGWTYLFVQFLRVYIIKKRSIVSTMADSQRQTFSYCTQAGIFDAAAVDIRQRGKVVARYRISLAEALRACQSLQVPT